jgi:glycosyltransferase involved in cell wall biosynthesis
MTAHLTEPCVRPRVAFIQDGARLHYALPLALQRAGLLERVFTEWFVTPGSFEDWSGRILQTVRPSLGRRVAERRCPGLNGRKVVSNPLLALWLHLSRLRFSSAEAFYTWWRGGFGRWVHRTGLGRANALFGFVRNLCPALCASCRRRGLVTVGDQIIAPAALEREEARRQARCWPGWQPAREADDGDRVIDMEGRTWQALAHITCPSDYVRQGLVKQGLDPRKITVLPYPIDVNAYPSPDRSPRKGPVVVGFVGAVNLRKGAPCFFEVARRFPPDQVRFVMVGPVGLDPAKAAAHKGPVDLIGPVPRSAIPAWLERFDIFFFPTTCEGSAGAVMEAMASGLPVVTTPNSGTVAREGIEGFLSSPGDTQSFTASIGRLADQPALRLQMGQAARRRAAEFDLEWYSGRLADLFMKLMIRVPGHKGF